VNKIFFTDSGATVEVKFFFDIWKKADYIKETTPDNSSCTPPLSGDEWKIWPAPEIRRGMLYKFYRKLTTQN
jgi:hypothetical protein